MVPGKGDDVLEARTFGGMKLAVVNLHRPRTLLVSLHPSLLVLRALRAINVVRIGDLVLGLLRLGQVLPVFTLVCRQTLPLLADRLGKIGLPLLLSWALQSGSLVLGLLAILAALTSEEDEGVLGALDVVLVAFLRPAFDDVTTA